MTGAPELRLHACRPGDELFLARELAGTLPEATHRVLGTGWLLSELAPAAQARSPMLAFATQTVPRARPLAVPSIARGSHALAEAVAAALAEHAGPWRLHVFGVEWPGSPVRGARCALLAREALARLPRRPALCAGLVRDPASPLTSDELVLQLALVQPRAGWFSATGPALARRLRGCLSRFPGGAVTVPDDPVPPSRAYRKLLEAEAHLGRAIAAGERCADLGAAPGGWTHVALGRGARVIAIDRSPLRADLMADPALTFVRADAFRWHPPAPPVDWLLADVVALPARSLDLLARWLARGWCRRFVVTLKFRGDDDYPLLDRAKSLLAREAAESLVRRLAHNRNEVTVLGLAHG